MDNKRQKIVLFGAGSVAQCVANYFSQDKKYDIIGCCVDGTYKVDTPSLGAIYDYSVLSDEIEKDEANIVVCVGYSRLNIDRQKIMSRVLGDGWTVGSLISDSHMCNGITYGHNTIIMPGANIQPFVNLGLGNIIWPGALIGHHSIVGDFNWFTSNSMIGGNALIGSRNFFGLGCSVLNNVRVGNNNIVNASATISKCVLDEEVYFGVSAKKHRMSSKSFVKLTSFGS
jgi:UDP-3-O-[3-hydroxymyristoyl] glucosamine N-acyltransferase